VKALALILAALVGCPASTPRAEETAAPVLPTPGTPDRSTLLTRYDFDEPYESWPLPGRLDEISGLAISDDGRLFAHDDERGRVHEIDRSTGDVGPRFDLGEQLARDDFEGIAIVGPRFFLVSSGGILYEFREVADRENTAYRVTDTRVGVRCEVEGLDYDAVLDALLLACKVSAPRNGPIVVERIPLDPDAPRLAPLTVDRAALPALGVDPDFEPSGIAVSPWGSLILVSASREAILEVDREGRVLSGRELSRRRHPQTEGIAFGPDGTLFLADERNDGRPRLTAYRPLGEDEVSS